MMNDYMATMSYLYKEAKSRWVDIKYTTENDITLCPRHDVDGNIICDTP